VAHIARGAFAAGIHLGYSDQVGGPARLELVTLDALLIYFLKKNCRENSRRFPAGKGRFAL
jgi:hypothetical protein